MASLICGQEKKSCDPLAIPKRIGLPCFALDPNRYSSAMLPIYIPIKTWEAYGRYLGGFRLGTRGGTSFFYAFVFVESELVSCFGDHRLAFYELPLSGFKLGKVDIAFKFRVDAGEKDF